MHKNLIPGTIGMQAFGTAKTKRRLPFLRLAWDECPTSCHENTKTCAHTKCTRWSDLVEESTSYNSTKEDERGANEFSIYPS
jgi:hypothetical protein